MCTAPDLVRTHRQRGAASLAVTMILLFLVLLVTLFGARSLVQDTRAGANEYQSARAFEAAEAGIEYGIAWLNANPPPHSFAADKSPYGVFTGCATASACERISTDLSLNLPNGFAVTVRLRRATVPLDAMNVIEVLAHAVSTADANTVARAQQKAFVSPFNKNKPGQTASPLLINGCLSGVTGSPDIIPKAAGASAIISSQAATCLDEGHFNLHGGAKTGNGFTGTAWDYLFPGISKTEMQTIAQTQIDAGLALTDRTVLWVTSGSPWHDSVGSAAKPVILIFAAASGCPKINGGPAIVGLVYFEGGCDSNGFGGATIDGTLAYEGSLTKFNSNTTLRYSSAVADLTGKGSNLGGKTPKLAGTWRDF